LLQLPDEIFGASESYGFIHEILVVLVLPPTQGYSLCDRNAAEDLVVLREHSGRLAEVAEPERLRVLAVDEDGPGHWLVRPSKELDEGRFADAIRPHDDDELTRSDGE
jgi:hypothetical protein